MTDIDPKLAILVLAAGKGTRMKSDRPKVLHRLAGLPLVSHVLGAAAPFGPARRIVVIGPDMDDVAAAVAPAETAIQHGQRGTGEAVQSAAQALAGFAGDVLILYGDSPLVTPATVAALRDRRRGPDDPAVVVLGFRPADPGAYGRIVTSGEGRPERIVEAAEATASELAIPLCNGGLMALDAARVLPLLSALSPANVKGELYLTDLVALARARGFPTALVECPEEELQGVNDRIQLSQAEAVMQRRLRRAAMLAGVTMTDPDSVFLAADTRFGRDVTIGPSVVFGPGVTVGAGVTINPFCHIEGATIGSGAVVGPFARLRPGTVMGAGAHVGNFVELKNAALGAGAKANHLTYLGDATVGAGSNIGAGVITCNYDGFDKHRTVIGEGVFIGSNSALVAPVSIGDGAMIGAGSTITRDVAPDALSIARGRQADMPGKAAGFRAARASSKKG